MLALPTGGYIAVATSDHATDPSTEDAFPIYQSEDLVNWQLQGNQHLDIDGESNLVTIRPEDCAGSIDH